MDRPHLTFACELEADALRTLLASPVVIDDLLALEATVAVGLLDLSLGRAEGVRRLNSAGVPAVAWLLLPKEQGYWFHAGNAPQAAARYAEFCTWTAEQGLSWAGVGVDVETDYAEMQALITGRWPSLLPRLLRRALDGGRVRRAQSAYRALVAQMHAGGYPVESYQFPLIVDERRAGSTLVQRLMGVVDVPADREVLMLYSSFLGKRGLGILWSYARDAQAAGIGSTGGGVESGQALPTLGWDELARDLRLARLRTCDLFVFSLEGCVRQGFLSRLRTLDWDAPVQPPTQPARLVDRLRATLCAVLWCSARPGLVVAGLLGMAWLIRRGRCRRR